MKTILKNKNLITLGIAETVSGVGTWITIMAVFSILIFKGGGDVWQSSGIMLAGLLPFGSQASSDNFFRWQESFIKRQVAASA